MESESQKHTQWRQSLKLQKSTARRLMRNRRIGRSKVRAVTTHRRIELKEHILPASIHAADSITFGPRNTVHGTRSSEYGHQVTSVVRQKGRPGQLFGAPRLNEPSHPHPIRPKSWFGLSRQARAVTDDSPIKLRPIRSKRSLTTKGFANGSVRRSHDQSKRANDAYMVLLIPENLMVAILSCMRIAPTFPLISRPFRWKWKA